MVKIMATQNTRQKRKDYIIALGLILLYALTTFGLWVATLNET